MSKAYKPLPAAEELWELFSYNPLTGNLHWREKPRHRLLQKDDPVGSLDNCSYRIAKIRGERYKAHRLIWKWTYGKDPAAELDHCNGIPTDNRLINLREATRSENLCNRRPHKRNTSGLKGVRRDGTRWAAKIEKDHQRFHLGIFDTPEEAHQAYCEAAKRLHGDFARLG